MSAVEFKLVTHVKRRKERGGKQRRNQLLRLMKKHNSRCVYCDTKVRQGNGQDRISTMATRDHIIPRHAGGPDIMLNYVLSCYSCNQILARLNL